MCSSSTIDRQLCHHQLRRRSNRFLNIGCAIVFRKEGRRRNQEGGAKAAQGRLGFVPLLMKEDVSPSWAVHLPNRVLANYSQPVQLISRE
mmetsp:Transcript_29516/g.71916  ORF Transcript_29516/g.71916 Transcript_29516/m.71916 type:complete len:90 (+) Transcript_29516:83-352(+)